MTTGENREEGQLEGPFIPLKVAKNSHIVGLQSLSLDVRETGVLRHNGGPAKGPHFAPKT